MSLEESHIEFLPSKPHSWDNLKKAVLKNIDATIDQVRPLPTAEVNLESLEETEPGTYLMAKRPTADLLMQLPKFKKGTAEVGIICVNGKWLISINNGMETTLPDTLTAIQHEHIFQVDLHSHPGSDPGSRQPSNEDIYKLDSTIDAKNYIISEAGLIEFQKAEYLPGGYTKSTEVHQAWKHWITVDLKLTEEEFNQQGGWNLKEEFYKKFFSMRTISWDNSEEINQILLGKEDLQSQR